MKRSQSRVKQVLKEVLENFDEEDFVKCKCKKEFSRTKKRTFNSRRKARPSFYPDPDDFTGNEKTFQIKYDKKLSSVAKFLLNSFQNKYLYYAIDDILYLLKSNPAERENLLAILYSPIISLQNNRFIDFLDIWIEEISISEVSKINKFLTTKTPSSIEQFNYITIKLFYRTRSLSCQKQKSIL